MNCETLFLFCAHRIKGLNLLPPRVEGEDFLSYLGYPETAAGRNQRQHDTRERRSWSVPGNPFQSNESNTRTRRLELARASKQLGTTRC